MGEFKFVNVKYCTHLARNVVVVSFFDEAGTVCSECLNKADCGFSESGCRNSLLRFVPLNVDSAVGEKAQA